MRVKALVFDVFGTVVDVRGSLLHDLLAFGKRRDESIDWSSFVDEWIGGYGNGVAAVRSGRQEWELVDDMIRSTLDRLLTQYGLKNIDNVERGFLNQAWRRLTPWPDSIEGLKQLRENFRIAPLSNANVSLMTDLSANVGLCWHEILSAEMAGRYKPDPAVYLLAANRLRLPVDEIMLVAAHKYDLIAASQVGLKTAFVPRPLERGPRGTADRPSSDDPFDVVADNFVDLARKLHVTDSQ